MKVVLEKNLEEINHGVTPHLSIFKDLKSFSTTKTRLLNLNDSVIAITLFECVQVMM